MSEVNIRPFNPDTQKVMDTLDGRFTQKQIIQNFFGLRDSVVIAEDGKTILEIFDDFNLDNQKIMLIFVSQTN